MQVSSLPPSGSDEQIRGQLKTMENGLNKLKAEIKHHKKVQDPHDKFAAKMEVCVCVHVLAMTCVHVCMWCVRWIWCSFKFVWLSLCLIVMYCLT